MSDSKELALSLAMADSEDDAIDILKGCNLWQDGSVWTDFGGISNNYGTIGNQQSRPESALVEKLVNSVDAVLMAECRKRGIDPVDENSPKDTLSAVERFFKIHGGRLSNLDPKSRTQLATRIALVSSGRKTRPCYHIIDDGEGQSPKRMPDTLLSLHKDNKVRIQFVQGRFNMGGTGALRFCGKHHLQLVISRRHPDVAAYDHSDASKDLWGCTVVRREEVPGLKSPVYRYLTPEKHGRVISFRADALPLRPQSYPDPYGEDMRWGTFIKLFDYEMPGLKTNILLDLYNRLSLMVPGIALPIRFYERRKGYSAHSYETTMSGLTVRLEEDRNENLEAGFTPSSSQIRLRGQSLGVSIYVFKPGQSEKYSKDEGVIFSVNGQAHGFLQRSFFKKKSVGMEYLANSILVIIDCSKLGPMARNDLFMASRDRLVRGEMKSELERKLEELLSTHQGLKELRMRRRQEALQNRLQDSKPLADVLQSILKKSPTLATLFSKGLRLPNPLDLEGKKVASEFAGKRFPTYFCLPKKYSPEDPKPCHLNRRFRLIFETDACNDYFEREQQPGSFELLLGSECQVNDYVLNLWNGRATLTASLPGEAQVSKIYKYQVAVGDLSRVEPLTEEFCIKVLEPVTKGRDNGGERKDPADDKRGRDREGPSGLALPEVIEVRQPDWHKHGFTEISALRVVDSGEGSHDFYVNLDNIHLLTEQKSANGVDPRILEARYKYGMVLIGLGILRLESDLSKYDLRVEQLPRLVEFASSAISPFLLPLVDGLSELEPVES